MGPAKIFFRIIDHANLLHKTRWQLYIEPVKNAELLQRKKESSAIHRVADFFYSGLHRDDG
ncbi:hypothetical protein [Paraburkholderia bonniea]|uniref:hypothetical protein n=1 Tax=Paraburkholderia bonniea TaxID=2152891 RepID=UPI0012922481|nr:hypothetical protein [Paraburkholderia bonniea]